MLHFADNTAANAAAIRGYSAAPDLAHLVARLHLSLARNRTRFWLAFVRSKANLADAPSREDGDLTLFESLGARRVTFTLPSLHGGSVDDVTASRFAALAGHIAACYARVWFRGDAPDTQSGAGELGGRGDGSKGPPFDLNHCGLALRLQRDRPPFTHMNRSAFVRIVACLSSA